MSFCQSQKKKRGPSAERTAAAALTDLMTALATALRQAAGRGGKGASAGKMLPRQPWCKRQCWHRWLRWQSSSVECAGGQEDKWWPWQRQRQWWGELWRKELAITKPRKEHVIPQVQNHGFFHAAPPTSVSLTPIPSPNCTREQQTKRQKPC